MTPNVLAQTLRQLADYADIRGVPLEASTWRRVAHDAELGGDDEVARLIQLARRNRLAEITTVHPTLQWKLRDLLIDGPDPSIGAAWSALPWLLRRLLEFAAINSAGAAALARDGVVTASDLSEAMHEGRLRGDVLDEARERLRLADETLTFERPRVTLGRAVDLLDNLMVVIATACPAVEGMTPAGDVRRVEPVVDSLVIAAHAPDPPAALEELAQVPTLRMLHRTNRRALVGYQQSEVDIRLAAPDEYGTALFAATGPREHVTAMRARGAPVRMSGREADVYADAGLPWIPPELRTGGDEIDAAARGRLPALVTREDVRGDLHLHTTYSDGRDSLVDMVQMAASLRLEYIAITDHSEHAGASKTLTIDALNRQRDEIDRLRDRFPGLTILHGVEVDIMEDGTLDFPDTVLDPLDIVLASLHDRRGHDPARLTRRCLAAIAHPLVNVITHPSNRLVGRDAGYDLDFPAVYAAAASSGTALEIDGAPTHLDLDGDHARAAVAAGVTVTIDSDCHKARLLDRQLRLGVGTARRGWVEARHVLNARPIAEVRQFIRAKRRPRV